MHGGIAPPNLELADVMLYCYNAHLCGMDGGGEGRARQMSNGTSQSYFSHTPYRTVVRYVYVTSEAWRLCDIEHVSAICIQIFV